MRKKLFVSIWICVLVLAFAACGDADNKRYAMNLYDENFHYARGIEAVFDKNGELKSAEVYIIYDKDYLDLPIAGNASDGEYPGATSGCILNDNGSMKVFCFVTARSIEAGALEDKNFYMISNIYDKLKTENAAAEFLKNQKQLAAESGIAAGGANYIVINGKNIDW